MDLRFSKASHDYSPSREEDLKGKYTNITAVVLIRNISTDKVKHPELSCMGKFEVVINI